LDNITVFYYIKKMFKQKFTLGALAAALILVGCADTKKNSKFRNKSSSNSANVSPTNGSTQNSDRVFFELNKYEILPSHMDSISAVVEYLKANPDYSVVVEGFCDACGTPAYNLQLSLKRSESGKVELTRHGISADRISTQGFGAKFRMPEGQEEVSVALDKKEFYISDANRGIRFKFVAK
jgi:peptidoglycan-associated lipoprotein